ncbi:MAG: cation-translocating P-type ATPase [Gammaproteobacteria bacterium]|nr:cation-translocating P-type ATPase [Gammaproteobacteria bacterium]
MSEQTAADQTVIPDDTKQGPDWHLLKVAEVLAHLHVDSQDGLDTAAVHERRERYGLNEIAEISRRGPWGILLGQFRDFMILVLIIAAVISGMVGEPQDTIAIVVIVMLNAVIGALQEFRAERAVAALRAMAAPEARVLREHQLRRLPANQLVPGDIVLLEAGMVVPADVRLLQAAGLTVNEAALTGESQPVEKHPAELSTADLAIGDRCNMAFKGTLVANGRGTGVVVATAMQTELGKVAQLLHGSELQQTPLQQRLAHFGKHLSIAVLVICAVIFLLGLLRGEPLVLMFLTAVTLAVAAIPEALPAVVTVSLAIGAHKMSTRNALIRRLPAVETLGSVTFICADKTGTLTQNRMQVNAILVDGERQPQLLPADRASLPWRLLGQALALNNDSQQDRADKISGDPTEVALYEAAAAAGFNRALLEQHLPRSGELPFDAVRKCMTTLHRDTEGVVAFIKGAPEKILSLCVQQLSASGTSALDVEALHVAAEQLAGEGDRVLAFAMRRFDRLPDTSQPEEIERAFTFLGLVGLVDPPRPEAAESVKLCRSAGITPVMITGDHAATARAIALSLGIATERDTIVTGAHLKQFSAAQLEAQACAIPVYARVTPEQKIRIVEALQAHGEFVAMTGDGVNDAPALKRAEIGVAMGEKGTDVAREAADMVLLDDNFATIVAAVAEGRRIFDNIRKFIKYTMTSNSGEIWTLLLAPFFGLPIPLLPIHILWINLVTDGLPGLAFTAEPSEAGIMQRPPRHPRETIFSHGMWQHMLWVGLLIGVVSIGAQAWSYTRGVEYWQTMVFTVLTVSQLFHSLAIRSERASLFSIGLRSNPAMLGAVLLTMALQLAVIYIPALNPIFHTQALPLADLVFCLVLSSTVLFAVEIEKWMVRRGVLYNR